MGTSGNRKGFKVFSINTTVRNPKRNLEFLKLFIPFDKKIISASEMETAFLFSAVKNGIYKFTDIPESVKIKIRDDIILTDNEVIQSFRDNPQATGFRGRALTQLRALKDQGFLMFHEAQRNHYKMTITKLGWELIKNETSATDIYTKAMIGLQANSPARPNIYNKSCPFLNTLFVINGVNKKLQKLNKEPKGIMIHEFATFVLSMKNCDFEKTINTIIEYRNIYGLLPNKIVLETFLNDEGILPLKYESIVKDYADEVFRKFEMTGLIIQHGCHNHIYYNFSEFNFSKIEILMDVYKDYKWLDFDSVEQYYDHLFNVKLPWQIDNNTQKNIITAKARLLNVPVDFTQITLSEAETLLEDKFNESKLNNVGKTILIEDLYNELLILSGTLPIMSKFNNIPEPLRLEYITALLIVKKFGSNGLIANLLLSDDGTPISHAPGKRPDIVFEHVDGSYIFELTMSKNARQQENSETTSIVRHLEEIKEATGINYRMALIAPIIHIDIVRFFKYCCVSNNALIAPLGIDKFVKDVRSAETLKDFTSAFDNAIFLLKNNHEKIYADEINKKFVL
jgi:hypothetical protein